MQGHLPGVQAVMSRLKKLTTLGPGRYPVRLPRERWWHLPKQRWWLHVELADEAFWNVMTTSHEHQHSRALGARAHAAYYDRQGEPTMVMETAHYFHEVREEAHRADVIHHLDCLINQAVIDRQ